MARVSTCNHHLRALRFVIPPLSASAISFASSCECCLQPGHGRRQLCPPHAFSTLRSFSSRLRMEACGTSSSSSSSASTFASSSGLAAQRQVDQKQDEEEQQQQQSSYRHDYLTPTLSVTVKCNGDIAEALVEALMSFGASSVSVEDGNSTAAKEDSSIGPVAWGQEKRQFWDECELTALFPPSLDVEESLGLAFSSVGFEGKLPYKMKKVEHKNWEQVVKDLFQPLKITDGLWIVPKWCTPPEASATNVILDPGLAFGTGDHPTTRLCLQWLNTTIKGGECILDYGIGSGILAISGLKLGAIHAVGVDIDPMSVSSAKHNASLNGFGPDTLQVFLAGNSEDDPLPMAQNQFDIVVANLLLNPLLELSGYLSSHVRPGGLLGLSGILESQVEQVRLKYGSCLENVEVLKHDGWACLHGRRKESTQTTESQNSSF